MEARTELFDTIFRIFNPIVSEKNKLQKEIAAQKKDKENQNHLLNEIENQFNTINEQLKILLPKFEALNESRIQENDLRLILQMLEFSEEIKLLKSTPSLIKRYIYNI